MNKEVVFKSRFAVGVCLVTVSVVIVILSVLVILANSSNKKNADNSSVAQLAACQKATVIADQLLKDWRSTSILLAEAGKATLNGDMSSTKADMVIATNQLDVIDNKESAYQQQENICSGSGQA